VVGIGRRWRGDWRRERRRRLAPHFTGGEEEEKRKTGMFRRGERERGGREGQLEVGGSAMYC